MDIDTLRAVPLFASLDRKAAAQLSRFLTIHDYERSSVVFHNRDPGTRCISSISERCASVSPMRTATS